MTTPRHRDFGAGGTENAAPLSFKLHGETYNCRPAVQGKVMLHLISNSDESKPAETAQMVFDFFGKVLLPEDYTRFQTLLESEDKIVKMEVLGDIVAWLVEEYSNRPMLGPEDSSVGA